MTFHSDQDRPHVVHMTSVHDPRDPRIFKKECRSLVNAGYRVTLVTAKGTSGTQDGVEIAAVGEARSRLERATRTAGRIYRQALKLDGDIYHFHDPELIPWALRLHSAGKRVIYDIHEDYFTDFRQKTYLPAPLRVIGAYVFRAFDRIAARRLACVIAETYYAELYPGATTALNYPIVDPAITESAGVDPSSWKVLYTGGVSHDRGAANLVRLLHHSADLKVHFIGRCPPYLAEDLRNIAGKNSDRLFIEGEGYYVDPGRIRQAYLEPQWLAAVTLFPERKDYARKIMTKWYEFMLAGLPIIYSDLPVWREFMDRHACGIGVAPNRPEEAVAALTWLRDNPDEARAMGRRGREAVLNHYSWDNEAEKLDRLYRRLLKESA